MNIGEIKRYVNNSQQPLNLLIGSPDDTENDLSVYGSQKKILMELESLKAEVEELKEAQAQGGREPIYVPDTEVLEVLDGYTSNYYTPSIEATAWYTSKDMIWYPKLNGAVYIEVSKSNSPQLIWKVLNFAALQDVFQVYYTSRLGGGYYRRIWQDLLRAILNSSGFYNAEVSQYISDTISLTSAADAYLNTGQKQIITVAKGMPVIFNVRNNASSILYRNELQINIYGKQV